MARENNKMITYDDASHMLANEGFNLENSDGFSNPNKKCLTRLEIESIFSNVHTGLFSNHGLKRLVPYQKIKAYEWVGVNFVCESGGTPSNPPYNPYDPSNPLNPTDPNNDEDIPMAVNARLVQPTLNPEYYLKVDVSYGVANFTYEFDQNTTNSVDQTLDTGSRRYSKFLGFSYPAFTITVTDSTGETYTKEFPSGANFDNPPTQTIYNHNIVYSDSPYDICTNDSVSENNNLSAFTIVSISPQITYTEVSYSLQNGNPAPAGYYSQQFLFEGSVYPGSPILVISDTGDKYIAYC